MWLHTLQTGNRIALWDRQGRVNLVDGPKLLWTFGKRIQALDHTAAGPDEYLRVVYMDGTTEHIAGPVELWKDPVRHETITVCQAINVDAHEAIVIYRQDGPKVDRRVLQGPARLVPGPTEWIHQFRWHGADPSHPTRKIPRALNFEKLRTIPDQMYIDIPNVRTADDALVVIRLMLFFELTDIERMLDRTHDPIADFLNAVTADVVDQVARHPFEVFKEKTERFNDLATYLQLTQRADSIGYHIAKVVYRGYHASDKLQQMHDQAIETRTRLKLEDETERQGQELEDMRLTREQAREQMKQDMAEADVKHRNNLEALQADQIRILEEKNHQAELKARAETLKMEAQAEADQLEIQLKHKKAVNAEQARHLEEIKQLDVDMTRYLVAQYQNPDRLLRIEGGDARVHVHEHEMENAG